MLALWARGVQWPTDGRCWIPGRGNELEILHWWFQRQLKPHGWSRHTLNRDTWLHSSLARSPSQILSRFPGLELMRLLLLCSSTAQTAGCTNKVIRPRLCHLQGPGRMLEGQLWPPWAPSGGLALRSNASGPSFQPACCGVPVARCQFAAAIAEQRPSSPGP